MQLYPNPAKWKADKTLKRARSAPIIKSIINRPARSNDLIIMGNVVFPWVEKGPFTASGYSTLGAIESSADRNKLKCHHCGNWFESLSQHLAREGISVRDYRRDHGLLQTTRLVAPTLHAKLSARALPQMQEFVARVKSAAHKEEAAKRSIVARAKHAISWRRTTGCAEARNLREECKAQLSLRIMAVASQVDRQPTVRELQDADIYLSAIKRAFDGRNMATIWRELGFAPRRRGEKLRCPRLPRASQAIYSQ